MTTSSATRRRLLALALLSAASAASLGAQLQPEPVYQTTLYVWSAGVGGTVQPLRGGPVLNIDRSFSELSQDLDAALFVSGLIRSGRVLVLGDFSYLAASRRGVVTLPGSGPVPAAGRLEQAALTLEGGYRVVDESRYSLDALVGLRTWWLTSDVLGAGGALQGSVRRDFTDPLLALRGRAQFSPRWSALAYVDGGGFGLGSESTLQAVGTVNFQASQLILLSAGYRRLDVDYRQDGARLDLSSGGPVFGLTFRF
jgi:hypothetical protein